MARAGLGLLVLAALFGLLQLRTLYLKRRARRLRRLVEERTRELQQANLQLDQLASTDPLTGLLNRRRFFEVASATRARAVFEGGGFALLLVDLDAFKAINDGHGHLAGDAVIRDAAARTLASCRAGDHVGRYGGEELIVCVEGANAARALEVAERIRAAIAAAPVRSGDSAIPVTASVGAAVWLGAGESLEALFARTDRALYRAKHEGRNRSVLCEDDAAEPQPA